MSKRIKMSELIESSKRAARLLMSVAVCLIGAAAWSPPALAAGGGVISGTVKLAGDGSGHIQDVVVSVEGLHYPATDGKRPAPADLVINQKDLSFSPHVLPVPVGVPVTFRNDDAVLHNVQSTTNVSAPFNFIMMKGRSKSVAFQREEIIPVHCNVHSEMSAYIVVKDNPFYARPDQSGHFTISGIPAGTYTIRLWDEHAGSADQRVSVADGSTATVNFTLGK